MTHISVCVCAQVAEDAHCGRRSHISLCQGPRPSLRSRGSFVRASCMTHDVFNHPVVHIVTNTLAPAIGYLAHLPSHSDGVVVKGIGTITNEGMVSPVTDNSTWHVAPLDPTTPTLSSISTNSEPNSLQPLSTSCLGIARSESENPMLRSPISPGSPSEQERQPTDDLEEMTPRSSSVTGVSQPLSVALRGVCRIARAAAWPRELRRDDL